jgi:hopanoid biosynthesis associated RND transporter like protein HpnN
LVAPAGLALGLAALAFVATHFSISTDTTALLSPKLPYLVRDAAFYHDFPLMNDQVVIVIDGKTAELAEGGAAALADKLTARPDLFASVRRPDGGPFWSQEGMLFEPAADVRKDMDRLISAEPFLGPIAADPSLRGLMQALSTTLKGVTTGQTTLESLHKPIARLADALDQLEAGRTSFFSWRTLVIDSTPDPHELRKIILVNPKLNYTKLRPGAAASQAIRDTAASLGLDPAHGLRVRLTGAIPLQDEEFGSLAERALPIALTAFLAIVLMLWLAVRAARIIIAILVTTLIGLILAATMGLLIYHSFNVISIAFIPLFVGLGIDFGIQFSVRYRAEHASEADGWRRALIGAGRRMGRPLVLAATAIGAGFLSFAPTAYEGVSQLGIIAGLGMFIALALNLTLLPALIYLARPAPAKRAQTATDTQISKLDTLVLEHRWRVVGGALLSALVCAGLLPFLHFDFNPMHLRSAKTESVATLLDLMKDPNNSPNTLEALRPTLAAAQDLAARAKALPQVSSARTVADFVPPDQAPKLAAIADASNLLDLALDPIITSPPPSDAEVVQALSSTTADLRATATDASPAAADARRLADALERLSRASPRMRDRASQMLMTPFSVELDQIRGVLAAQPVTLQSLPKDVTRDWIGLDGRVRVQIEPRGDSNNNIVLGHFIDAVTKIAPDVTGPAIGIRNGGKAVVQAFIEAGVLSFIAITALLFAVLRQVRDVAITMAPIVLTGLLTLGSCVILGQPLNFANIIALPLLFGIGVAFHIYFVMSWRAGGSHLLNSSLARAVFFSALTTATGFGSLWLSSHPGTASMGKLLMISLIWTLVSALIFQPALMGPPPAERAVGDEAHDSPDELDGEPA